MSKAILIILDGWGINPDPAVSAIEAANTPYYDALINQYPHATLITHGEHVGLPDGQMGNSEVGHLNIGAGRIIYQDLARINKAVVEGEIHNNQLLIEALQNTKGRVHIIGLVSNGGVHSHIDHLKAIASASRENFSGEIFVHAFTDGRDVAPKSGLGFIHELKNELDPLQIPIVSVVGRYYAMDRDRRWERTKVAYDLLVRGMGEHTHDLLSSIKASYEKGTTDEFIQPHVLIDSSGIPFGQIRDGDTVIFFNFRTDRPRQLTEALSQTMFPEHDMQPVSVHMITMTSYDDRYKDVTVLFPDVDITSTLGEYLQQLDKTQLRVAETEKYPHVSYFFSGGREEPFTGEERILIPSPKVPTYDLLPEMSAVSVTEATLEYIASHEPDFICLNYANTDMVGHTGVFKAAVIAAETVDQCLQQLVPYCLEKRYSVLIIADHGNADIMINPDGSPHTAHTKNPVPVIFVSNEKGLRVNNGILADIAPTILDAMELPKPETMTGTSLLQKN